MSEKIDAVIAIAKRSAEKVERSGATMDKKLASAKVLITTALKNQAK